MEDKHCPGLDPKLYSVILEKCLHSLGLPNTNAAIGGGLCGKAFLSNGKVYKLTTDKSEAIESNKLIGKKNSNIADIYNVKEVNTSLTNEGVYLIVLEHLNTDKHSIFYEIQEELIDLFDKHFNEHLFDVLYHYRFDPTLYKNEYEYDVNQLLNTHQREKYYYTSLLSICDDLRKNNIESLDLQYHNLGIKPNGNLAFFDLGFGEVTTGNLNTINIGEANKIVVNEFLADIKNAVEKQNITIEEFAKRIAEKLGYNVQPILVGKGTQGFAFDLNNGMIIKITSDKTEANEAIKLLGKHNNYIGDFYRVYNISPPYQNVYVILREKLELTSESEEKFDVAYRNFYKFLTDNGMNGYDVKDIIVHGATEKLNRIVQFINDDNSYLAESARVILNVIQELIKENIRSIDFNSENFGLKKNGNLAYYDIGYSENKDDVNFDQLSISERVMTYMKNSSAVKVKKKCQLGGNGDGTSTACNQGDISNIELSPIKENEYIDWDKNYNKSFSLVYTPKDATDNYEDGLLSVVTPENGSSWNDWKQVDQNTINTWRANWNNIQKTLAPHKYQQILKHIIREQKSIKESVDGLAYGKWKRNNVTYRGISADADVSGENGGSDVLGKGLYSVPASNKTMARQYGELKMLVNARPKNPKIFNTLNEWEIWFQNNLVFPLSQAKGKNFPDKRDFDSLTDIASEMIKRGYDGIIIKGREMVNYKPVDMRYYSTERQLELYYYDNVANQSLNEETFFRVDSGFLPPRQTSAYDLIMHEMHENGNIEEMQGALNIANQNGIDLKKYSSRDVIWVTKTPEDALRYEPDEDLENVDQIQINNPLILANDGDEGYLVLMLKQPIQEHTSKWKSKYLHKFKEIVEEELSVLDTTEEKPIFEPMGEDIKTGINDLPFKNEVEQAGGKIYSVGGAVRDNILGRESKDLDLLITGIPLDQLEQILHKYGKVDNVGKSFGIIKFNTPQTGELDIAIPRLERKNDIGGYRGFNVTSDHTLPIEKDLERRDFTINAIAKDSSGLMIDPYGGQEDIQKKQIKMVNPQAFSDDPLRMLRAVQFAARFDFNIEPQTMHEIQKNASKIREISPERILIEFDKIVKKGKPLVGAKLLRQSGLYDQIFGTSRGINLADFNQVKTMGEFVYELIKGAVQNPAEFFKNNLKGDLDTYNEIKALQLGGQFKGDKKTIFDMYKTFPKSIDTAVFGENFTNGVKYMRDHNIPFSLKEVPVNGNDLIGLGYQGKQIGDMFVEILSKIYNEELPNEREAIMNYINGKKGLNENIYSLTGDDYKRLTDGELVREIRKVIEYKDRNTDGTSNYSSSEDLYEYLYTHLALAYNRDRVWNLLTKFSNTESVKYSDNKGMMIKKLQNVGLLRG